MMDWVSVVGSSLCYLLAATEFAVQDLLTMPHKAVSSWWGYAVAAALYCLQIQEMLIGESSASKVRIEVGAVSVKYHFDLSFHYADYFKYR